MQTTERDASPSDEERAAPSRRRWSYIDPGLVFVVALLMRVGLVLNSAGGIRGEFAYDGSVYYAAADALIHGRMPYADYVQLHPPGLVLVLAPFALIGRLTTDHTGFVVANTAFEFLGALNAVLVVLVARRVGLTRWAAIGGGLFYALWAESDYAEIGIRLEPLGNFALLLGLLLLVRAPESAADPAATDGSRRSGGGRWALLAGVAFGVAVMTKVWWVLPVVVVLGGALLRRPTRRAGGQALLTTVVTGVVVAGPFFAYAPAAMFRMIIADQIGRPKHNDSLVRRLRQMTSVTDLLPHVTLDASTHIFVVVAIIALGFAASAWRFRWLRVVVVALALQLLIVLASPIYYPYYADYLAPFLALLVAGGLSVSDARGLVRRSTQVTALIAAVTVVVAAVVSIGTVAGKYVDPYAPTKFPGPYFAARTGGLRCVMSDSPSGLIQLDVLSRGLANGCEQWVDITGRFYDMDKLKDRPGVSRHDDPRWQRDLGRYLFSGDALILVRSDTGVAPSLMRRVRALPVIAARGKYRLHRVPARLRTTAQHTIQH